MSIFRQFNKTICASRFTKPNNILLAQTSPLVLCTSYQPSIDYLNTLKSLFRTIERLQSHQNSKRFKSQIASELGFLKSNTSVYIEQSLRYVEAGGRLTAQGVANLYAVADKLNVNTEWLQIYAQPEIPHLIKNMSIQNLEDLLAGLKKYKGSESIIALAENQLKSRNRQNYQYVKRSVQQSAVFEQDTAPSSNHPLINAIQSKQSYISFAACRLLSNALSLINNGRRPGHALD